MPSENKVLIVAAEASSTLYAQRILELWNQQGKEVSCFGVGSEEMQKLGFEAIGRSEDMAVVGLQEVLAHYKDIRKVFYDILEKAKKEKPKFALLLDYPDFNLRLAEKLKKMGIPVIYYISPQVWAWRQSRVKKIKKIVDKMLVLFPFEEGFYQKHNVPVSFVGHPLLDELDDKYFSNDYRDEKRSRYGITPGDVLVGLMPGSRKSELKHHLQTQIETAEKIYQERPRVKFALLTAPTFEVDEIKEYLPDYKLPLVILKDEPMEMIQMADVILTASGTATLLVGLLRRPLVIMYKMKAFTAVLAKLFVRSTKYFGMINLVLDKLVAPEFFQEQANVEQLSKTVLELVDSKDKRDKMSSELARASENLGSKGATKRVVETVEEYF